LLRGVSVRTYYTKYITAYNVVCSRLGNDKLMEASNQNGKMFRIFVTQLEHNRLSNNKLAEILVLILGLRLLVPGI